MNTEFLYALYANDKYGKVNGSHLYKLLSKSDLINEIIKFGSIEKFIKHSDIN